MKVLILAIGLLYSAGALAHNEMHWFKTELTCADARVTVRAYCEETPASNRVIQRNSLCSEQTLVIERPGRPKVERNLLERQPDDGEVPLLLSSVSCIGAGKKAHLSGLMDNGGNCRTCERGVVLDLNGRWKYDGKRWLVRGPERRLIETQERKSHTTERISITNTMRDTAGEK